MHRSFVTANQRQFIANRAKGHCEYCKIPADFASQSFSVEHIIPISRGGKTALDNLALACPGCNAHKYNKIEAPDPVDGMSAPLFNPRKQQWQDHFRWSDNFFHIVGLTPTGRATVIALQMNRPCLVNMRRALFAIGFHPPVENDE